MDDLVVAQAADQLGVDPSRVRQLLRAGALQGRHVGRDWLISARSVAALQQLPPSPGRPAVPRRAWALLDLLDGGKAAWLDPVARSKVRAQISRLVGADTPVWAKALKGREDCYSVSGHRAAIGRLLQNPDVWPAGPAAAAEFGGADLVVHQAIPEAYVRADRWPGLAERLRLHAAEGHPDVWVRVPRQLWPFGPAGPGRAALAATIVDAGEWRARRAGVEILNDLAMAIRK
jgi:hypothetical protein